MFYHLVGEIEKNITYTTDINSGLLTTLLPQLNLKRYDARGFCNVINVMSVGQLPKEVEIRREFKKIKKK